MYKIVLKTIGCILLIAYLAVCGFVWRIGNEPQKYRSVHVAICDSDQAQFIGAIDVLRAIQPDSINPLGHQVAEYNTYRLQQLIKRNSLIRDVYCYPTPDSALQIDLYQRIPLLRIKSSKLNRDYYLDTEGNLMRYKASAKPVQVPLATGHISEQYATTDLFVLAEFLDNHKLWRNAFTQIYVEENGDIRLIPRIGDHTVLLGPANDIEQKFDHLERFYKKVLNKKGWNLYKTINLKFKGQVVAEHRD